MVATVAADLQRAFEFPCKEMRFAAVAFNEDVFSLYDALFRRNCFYAL